MILISIISIITLTANAASRYILADYTTPDEDNYQTATTSELVPYPIDICVIYEMTTTTFKYGKFECNDANDQVTFTYYSDSGCTTSTGSEVITDTTTFNCAGEDNYVVVDGCSVYVQSNPPSAGGQVCCQQEPANPLIAGCVEKIVATDVCKSTTSDDYGDVYVMVTCDATTTTTTIYSDAYCSVAVTTLDEYAATVGDCAYASTITGFVDIYSRMPSCVADGVELATDTYCD